MTGKDRKEVKIIRTQGKPPVPKLATQSGAATALDRAWPAIVRECRQVLGSELHYQAMIYHCLRTYGDVPVRQVGMNVKMMTWKPLTAFFRGLDALREKNFRGGVEPIPDVVIFKPGIRGDWRRRVFLRAQNIRETLQQLLMVIEIKASERLDSRLSPGEILRDIQKLASQRKEINYRRSDFLPVMLVVDTAPLEIERLRAKTVAMLREEADRNDVLFYYLSLKTSLPVIADHT